MSAVLSYGADDRPDSLIPSSAAFRDPEHLACLRCLLDELKQAFWPAPKDLRRALVHYQEDRSTLARLPAKHPLAVSPGVADFYAVNPTDRYLVVAGPRGSGKSTLVRTVEYLDNGHIFGVTRTSGTHPLKEWPAVPSMRTFHIDLKLNEHRLALEPGNDTQRPVCDLIFEVLMDELLQPLRAKRSASLKSSIDDFERRFHEYVLFSGATAKLREFNKIARARVGARRYGDKKACLRAIAADDDLSAAKRAALNDFATAQGTARLRVLIDFLDDLGHHPTVILDNADRFGRRLHRELNREILLIVSNAQNLRVVLPLRNSSLPSLGAAGETSRTTVYALGRRITASQYEDTWSDDMRDVEPGEPDPLLKEPDADQLGTPKAQDLRRDLFVDVLVRRMTFLQRMLTNGPDEIVGYR